MKSQKTSLSHKIHQNSANLNNVGLKRNKFERKNKTNYRDL